MVPRPKAKKAKSSKKNIASSKLPIAVALDGDWKSSKIWLDRLKGLVWGFKVGSILFTEKGPSVIEAIQKRGFSVFLDLKYHDIPNTVQGAVKEAFSWGVSVTTVHAAGGVEMLKAAASEQRPEQIIVAVTVLTSLDEINLRAVGVNRPLAEHMHALSELSLECGIRGLVSSPQEVASLRRRFPEAFLVTPGIRLGEAHDQKRTGSLSQALADGSSLVVLGRALTESQDWEDSWQNLTSSLDATFSKKRSK